MQTSLQFITISITANQIPRISFFSHLSEHYDPMRFACHPVDILIPTSISRSHYRLDGRRFNMAFTYLTYQFLFLFPFLLLHLHRIALPYPSLPITSLSPLISSPQYPHYMKRNTNWLKVMLQRKRYKALTSYKTFATGRVDMRCVSVPMFAWEVILPSISPLATPTASISPLATPTAPISPLATPTAPISPLATPTAPISPLATPTAPISPLSTPTAPISPLATPIVPILPLDTPTSYFIHSHSYPSYANSDSSEPHGKRASFVPS